MAQRRTRAERGSATVEMMVAFPVVLGLFWLGAQVGIGFYGRTVALAAAESGARAGAVELGTTGDCRTAAQAMLATAADALVDTEVSCRRTATAVSVTVRGRALAVGPWPGPTVSMTAELPVERLT